MGKIPGVPSPAGTPAESVGAVDSDNIGPLDERTRSGRPGSELSDGPKIGTRGEFLPARYVLPDKEIESKSGRITVVTGVICEDH